MRHPASGSLIVLLPVLFVSGCLLGSDNDDRERDWARVRAIEAEVDLLVGVPQCADSTLCAYIGVGSKACGGPRRYAIYSKATTDSALLAERVRYLNALEDHFNRKYGVYSDCSVPNLPRLGCVDGVCVDLNRPGK